MPEDPWVRVEALRWYPTRLGMVIGLVAMIDQRGGYFKVYIGLASGDDTHNDALQIARHGAPIMDEPLARLLAGARWKKLPYAR